MTNRDGVSFHSDYIPPPPTSSQFSARRVRPARWRGRELTGAFPADVDPARLPSTFAQVTALRPKAEMVDSSNPFWIPPPGTREGPRPAFPQVRGPLSTWWQVKDSNLRSFRDGFTVPRLQTCDQRKRLSRNNFHAYSPQIADDHRQQPDTQRAMRPLGIVPPHRAPHLRPWSSPSRRQGRTPTRERAWGREQESRSRQFNNWLVESWGVERFRYWRVGRGSGSGWAMAALVSVWLTCSRKTVTSGARAAPPCSKA